MAEVNAEAERLDDVPHNDTLERALLGCVMIKPDTIHDIKRIVKTSKAFYRQQHRIIWETMLEMEDGPLDIDELTLMETLLDKSIGRKTGLDVVGGQHYVVTLRDEVAAISNAEHYARQVMELHRRRVLIRNSKEAYLRLLSGATSDEAIRLYNTGIQEATEVDTDDGSSDGLLKQWDDWYTRRVTGSAGALKCGLPVVDALLVWEPGEVHMIGAATGMGKTKLMSAIIGNMLMYHVPRNNDGEPTGPSNVVVSIHQTEVARPKLAARIATAMLGGSVREQHLVRPEDAPDHLRGKQKAKADKAIAWLEEQDVWIRDSRELTLEEIKTETRRLRSRFPERPLIVFVDYLQMITVEDAKDEYREIGEAIRTLVNLATETKCVMVVVTQMTEKSGEVVPLTMPPANTVKGNRKAKDAPARFIKWHRTYAYGDKPEFAVLELEKDRYGTPGHVLCRADLSTNQITPWDEVPPEAPGVYTPQVDPDDYP